jgi:hypothetical protein
VKLERKGMNEFDGMGLEEKMREFFQKISVRVFAENDKLTLMIIVF